MAFTASKQWELVGLTSYGRGCANHEHSGSYTRLTAYQEFIELVMNGKYITPTTRTCSCQCPYGSNKGTAFTKVNSTNACVDACKAVSSNSCNNDNTYACLGTDCVYSATYIHNCSCQCPFGSTPTFTYTFRNSKEACVNACVAVPSNNCIRSNTYVCLEDDCAYSSSYDNSSPNVPVGFECSCQCPYGSNKGSAFTKVNSTNACVDACKAVSSNSCNKYNTYACIGTDCVYSATYIHNCSCHCPFGSTPTFTYTFGNSTEACVNACVAVPSNNCIRSNTYVCLEDDCAYSSSYDNSSANVPVGFECSCQCPYGSNKSSAFTKVNSTNACVDACKAVSSNSCNNYNTYACLGTACTYSIWYVNSSSIVMGSHRCSCQCPFGSDQGWAYARTNSTEGCVSACIAVSSNSCNNYNTYACLGTDCVYSATYIHNCSCQCPFGSSQSFAYTFRNSTEACVNTCVAVPSNNCIRSNTYVCLEDDCAYSSSYDNSSATVPVRFECSCQCPFGSNKGSAFTKVNSTNACVDVCKAVSSNSCNNYNTYACVGTDCVYSATYIHNCSCQCPFGSTPTFKYTFRNSTEACVNACVAVPSNNCIRSNTYVCLEDDCAYSSSYDNSSANVPVGFECSCQCPYGSNKSSAFTKVNSTNACVDACKAVSSNSCNNYNTYACLGTACTYSIWYVNSLSIVMGSYRCSCQCPFGSDQGWAYASTNSTDGCVSACIAVSSNRCVRSNTYACLGTDCVYSASYFHNCSCQCPFGSSQSFAYTFRNSTEACVNACVAVSSNNCIRSNTYVCLEDNCAYSSSYDNSSATVPVRFECSCQCPFGSNKGSAFTKVNSTNACVDVCKAVSSNSCNKYNTYACLGTDCVYSANYIHNCSCQCPFGSTPTFTYTFGNSTEACVNACVAVPSNNCIRSNTYVCLEDNCAYSNSYENSSVTVPGRYRCSCYCPHGSYQGVALSKMNLTEACIYACIAVPLNLCRAYNTYACLGTNCVYSSSYNYWSTTMPARYRCSCQCPYGYDQGIAYATQYSPQGCVDACKAVQTNACSGWNTYACLGTDCAYSSSYRNTSSTLPVGYKCVCQCPYGSDQGVAYTNENATAACVNACKAVPWNSCDSSNTYACLGTECMYSNSYIN